MTAGWDRPAFEERLARAPDRPALEALFAELVECKEAWAGPMRLRIGSKLAALRKRQLEVAGVARGSGFDALLAAYDLPPSDGRPLYQYHVTTELFERLQAELRAHAAKGTLGAKLVPGLFVLWAAEWFRRRHQGGLRRWQDIGDVLGCSFEQSKWREYADRGLKLWGRNALFINGTRHRLLTLAREGGFPVAALEGDAGWASRLLTNTVGGLLGIPEPDEEIATRLARANAGCAPSLWQDDEFYSLCADLSLAIVELRREADVPAAAAGFPVSVWLDANRPDWRTTLPVTTDNEAGRRLVDGLIRAEAIKTRAGDVKAVRLLRKEGGGWTPVVRLDLAGLIEGDAVKELDTDLGRLRAFPSGELARYIGGELALLEPPEQGEVGWLVRPLHRARPVAAAPFYVPAELELRADGRPVKRIMLPRGAPVRSHLQTFAVEAEVDEQPVELSILGTGSGSYRAETVYVHVPDNWSVRPDGEGASVAFFEPGLQGHQLWRIDDGAIVAAPSGDTYRVLTGQSSDRRDRLVLLGNRPLHLRPCDPATELFCGGPAVRVCEGTVEKAPHDDELFVRALGEQWVPATLPLKPGLYDLGWKHRQTGHLRDRRRIGVLPAGLSISIRAGRHKAEYRIVGWDGIKIEQAAKEGDSWSYVISGKSSRSIRCELRWADDSTAMAELPVPHRASLARWEGGLLTPKSIFKLSEASKIVACSDTPTVLMAQLRDGERRPVPGAELRWLVNDELPISAIRDDLASLLLPCGDIDAEVELGFNDSFEDYWHVRLFDGRLDIEAAGVIAPRGVVDRSARLMGRAMTKPDEEKDLGAYSLEEALNHRPLLLPKQLYGPWLMYLRSADGILTRPILVEGKPLAATPQGRLAKVMCIPGYAERKAALEQICGNILAGGEDGYELIRDIISLITSLRGLPPATFDILARVASQPDVAARLALFATDSEKADMLQLAEGLPFAWYTIPKHCWERAAAAYCDFFIPKLQPVYGDGAVAEVLKMAAASARTIADHQPLLAPLLNISCPSVTILEAAQNFIRRSADKVADFHSDSLFRQAIPDELPACFARFEERYVGILDAPCAAAVAASGRFQPDAGQLRRIKAVERGNPMYFAEAFSAWYQERLNG